jgi:hypothetical protein
MHLLIHGQSFREREGNHNDVDFSALKLIPECLHLSKVRLARESSKMAQKNDQQKPMRRDLPQVYAPSFEIKERDVIQRDQPSLHLSALPILNRLP